MIPIEFCFCFFRTLLEVLNGRDKNTCPMTFSFYKIKKDNKDKHSLSTLKMMLILSWFIIFVLCIKYLSVQGEIFHVLRFGAYPNDNIDDAKAIQLAVNTAISSRFNSTIIFGYGTYNLSSTINKNQNPYWLVPMGFSIVETKKNT
jgi:hypothetical protein